MSIRLRFTLLYNAILAVTLAIFGLSLYAIQSHSTYDALKMDLIRSNSAVGTSVMNSTAGGGSLVLPVSPNVEHPPDTGKFPHPSTNLSNEPVFKKLPEREIIRILDGSGTLVASPYGLTDTLLPLSAAGLQALQGKQDWWETGTFQEQSVLIYSHAIVQNDKLTYIIQVARPMTERERMMASLAVTLLIACLLTIIVAFGIGWLFAGAMLAPIKYLTRTAGAIGDERDFTRRVDYSGPQDEVGQLASTFNIMLARLQDAYQQVEHSLEMQRGFVADVSHELRTPLTTLRGNLGLLRRNPPIPLEEQNDILADMTHEGDRMIRLVNDLLVLARADAGRSLVKEPFDVLPLLDETCRHARQLDPQRQIDLDADDLKALGDRDAFKQVLLIGLDNSLKHTTGTVIVSARQTGRLVEVRVQDHGEGISADQCEHIFDRFYRGEDAAAIPGFGLGLPIAKSLITGMDGEIRMESQPGQGSMLIITVRAPQTPTLK